MTLLKRTWNSNHELQENGKVQATFHTGWKNWLDSDDEWKEIEVDLVDFGDYYGVEKAPFTVKLPKLSTGEAIFISDNRYDPLTKKIIQDEPLEMSITAQDVKEVPAKLETGDFGFGNMEYVVYEGAYPNADLIYFVDSYPSLRKIIRFNKNPNAESDLEYKFALSFDKETEIWEGEDLKNAVDTQGEFEIYSKLEDDRIIRILSAYVWHEWNSKLEKAGNEMVNKSDRTPINVSYDGSILTKTIPKSYLDNASYPVYADASISFSPSPGTADGYTYWQNSSGTSWATARSSAGNFLFNTTTAMVVGLVSHTDTNEWSFIFRGTAMFDTSSLNDSLPITGARLNMTINMLSNGFNQKLAIVSRTTASDTALALADHPIGNFGSTHFTDTDIDLVDGVVSAPLNASGIAHINKTGVTKFGLLTTADADNSPPTWASFLNDYSEIQTSEGTGITLTVDYDPYPVSNLLTLGVG